MRDLARVTALTVRLQFRSHFVRRRQVPLDGEPAERLPGRWSKRRLHDRLQLLEDVTVVVKVPLTGELAVRFGQPIKKSIAGVHPESGLSELSFPVIPQHIHGDQPHPRPE